MRVVYIVMHALPLSGWKQFSLRCFVEGENTIASSLKAASHRDASLVGWKMTEIRAGAFYLRFQGQVACGLAGKIYGRFPGCWVTLQRMFASRLTTAAAAVLMMKMIASSPAYHHQPASIFSPPLLLYCYTYACSNAWEIVSLLA